MRFPSLITEGIPFIDPAANTVLVDSGPLGAGYYTIDWIGTCEPPHLMLLQHRNAQHTDNQYQQMLVIGNTHEHFPVPLTLAMNERIRLLARGNITGDVQVTLIVTRWSSPEEGAA